MAQEDSHPQRPDRKAEQKAAGALNDQRASPASNQPAVAPGVSSLSTRDAEAPSPLSRRPQQPEKSHAVETRRSGPDDAGRDDIREAPTRPAPAAQSGQPSFAANWKFLLLIAATSIVCGAAGAWAMSEFAGSSQRSDDQASSDQNGQTQSGDSDSSQSGKQTAVGKQTSSGKQQGSGKKDKSSDQGGASAADIPGFTSADDAATLKKQIKHLADRLEQIDRRMDQLQKPETETPPAVHTLQIKIAELSKEVEQAANLPAQFRRMEHRLSAVEQELKALREALPADDMPDD